MKITSIALAAFSLVLLPWLAFGEEQITDRSGRVVEIRQQRGNASYAYDGYRNPIYVGIGIQGGKGTLDYRDQHGVHVGVGGPGTLPWAVRGTWGSK
ncbi:MAG: hypothetical protein HY912_19710 [Desulfomonile tiedjei]|uniref:Uncharacterized protein n=1 Tax=Desulfomonile tiedjei TaxID=2358 RepID=A0A9D6V6X7_9BACT|nr:hypothetical protein [Desulfomonile tiedjei]